jgi:hypothetical protein
MMAATVTRHAERRVRERLGLPKRTVQKLADRALSEGSPYTDFSGAFRHYLNGVLMEGGNAENLRVFNQYLFLFAGERLITVWVLPHRFRGIRPSMSAIELAIQAEIQSLALPIEYAQETNNASASP